MYTYLILINIIGFITCFIDKRKAINNKYRIKEITLLLISLIGGCFGFYIGMYMFHHKTKKLKFILLVPIMIIMWIVLIIYLIKNNSIP